jgi:hypothetical protein
VGTAPAAEIAMIMRRRRRRRRTKPVFSYKGACDQDEVQRFWKEERKGVRLEGKGGKEIEK